MFIPYLELVSLFCVLLMTESSHCCPTIITSAGKHRSPHRVDRKFSLRLFLISQITVDLCTDGRENGPAAVSVQEKRSLPGTAQPPLASVSFSQSRNVIFHLNALFSSCLVADPCCCHGSTDHYHSYHRKPFDFGMQCPQHREPHQSVGATATTAAVSDLSFTAFRSKNERQILRRALNRMYCLTQPRCSSPAAVDSQSSVKSLVELN